MCAALIVAAGASLIAANPGEAHNGKVHDGEVHDGEVHDGEDLNLTGGFLCKFTWTRADHIREKILDRMKVRHKRFIRFTVPVLGYYNSENSISNYTGLLTWVWVMDSHEYMLYYPHNFLYTSLYTLSIIVQDHALDIEGPVSLKGLGADLGRFNERDRDVGFCDAGCISENRSCGIGELSLKDLLHNITDYKWYWLCLQLPHAYDVEDLEVMPHDAFPDLLYYWRFLRKFFTQRPNLGWTDDKKDFLHYYCYNRDGNHGNEGKELLMKFWVIPWVAFMMWLYFPLLVHFFPSSSAKKKRDSKMFPSYKTPIYLGRLLKRVLCFYRNDQVCQTLVLIRIRRIFFLLLLVATSFRLLSRPHPYVYYIWIMVSVLAAASCVPHYFSTYLDDLRSPSKFLVWDLPQGILREDDHLCEYQLLSHLMLERICMVVDSRFWAFLINEILLPNSIQYFWQSKFPQKVLDVVHIIVIGFPLLFLSIVFYMLFWFVPLPYFSWQLICAMWEGKRHFTRSGPQCVCWDMLVSSHLVTMVTMLLLTLVVTYTWCLAIAEFTIFTMIGGAVTPNIALQYFLLIGSVIGTIYGMVRNLHEGYDQILKEIIDILKEEGTRESLQESLASKHSGAVVLVKEPAANSQWAHTILLVTGQPNSSPLTLLWYNSTSTDVRTDMYFDIVEKCRPVRRQVFFILVKIIAMTFYIVVAMWVKNVYHLEEKVGAIVGVINNVAVYFIPGLLQYIAYQNNFGARKTATLRQSVYNALLQHFDDLA
jgi:hypothetical protein